MPALPVRRRLLTDIYEHSRTIRDNLRSPKKRTRIAVNGLQMRVDDATVCVRGAPSPPYVSVYNGGAIHHRNLFGTKSDSPFNPFKFR